MLMAQILDERGFLYGPMKVDRMRMVEDGLVEFVIERWAPPVDCAIVGVLLGQRVRRLQCHEKIICMVGDTATFTIRLTLYTPETKEAFHMKLAELVYRDPMFELEHGPSFLDWVVRL